MKQVTSFMVLNVNGMNRVSFTYDTISDETGDLYDTNNKESFFVVDSTLGGHIDAIRDYILTNKLGY